LVGERRFERGASNRCRTTLHQLPCLNHMLRPFKCGKVFEIRNPGEDTLP
jgi:hypothetical protein